MDEILGEFKAESKEFVVQMLAILEDIESQPSQIQRLEEVGLLADRIMGTAKSLVVQGFGGADVGRIASYGELCKLVSYKGSQIADQPQLASVVIALLLDATEMLDQMMEELGSESGPSPDSSLNETFLDRLRWVSQQFDQNLRGTVAVSGAQLAQAQIDQILKKIKS